MPTPFIMPKMDMDQEYATITAWLKQEGDYVEQGEPVLTVETDKISSDIEAPASGTLAGILYPEHSEVPVTQVVAYILAEGESLRDAEALAEPADQGSARSHLVSLFNEPSTSADYSKNKTEGNPVKQDPRVSATPAARREAAQRNIALEDVPGSGPGGRVQAEDVRSAVQPAQKSSNPSELIPYSGKRKASGERLTASWQGVPHFYLNTEVNMLAREAARSAANAQAEAGAKPGLTLSAYLVKALAETLVQHPYLNASLDADGIHLWQQVHIGVATALPEGLIVPVIHNADQLSLAEINTRLRELSQRARSGQLTRAELEGGTFTLSNLGMFGVQSFTAIINPPQVAILAVGSLVRKLVVVDETDTLAVRPMIALSLGLDHRVVDGAMGALFLRDLVRHLENPPE